MQCNITLSDEVNCVINGLLSHHVFELYDMFGIYTTNYKFAPNYQLGKWDGKIRYFHKTGKTFYHLLPTIIPIITKWKYNIQIIDNRKTTYIKIKNITNKFFADLNINTNNKPWIMRDYQVNMVNTLLQEGHGIGICGTGGGKTSICAALTLYYQQTNNLRTIIIVPDKNLIQQTVLQYEFFGIDIGQYSGDKKQINHQHLVSTWQSLNNNHMLLQQFNVIIVDECHGVRGKTLSHLLSVIGKNIQFRFGVTGTLPKEQTDLMTIKTCLGDVKYQVSANQLIQTGHLSQLNINVYKLVTNVKQLYSEYIEQTDINQIQQLSYSQFKSEFLPDYQSEKKFLLKDQSRINWIVNLIINIHKQQKGNILCLVNSIKFGNMLTDNIENAVFLSGKIKMEDRKYIYDMFDKKNELIVIATVHIAGVGLDIQRIHNLMFIDMGRSFIRTIQTIGRGLRKSYDKKVVQVYDICSDLKYSLIHMNQRVQYYHQAKYPHNIKKIVI